jgi:hypothetical protein
LLNKFPNFDDARKIQFPKLHKTENNFKWFEEVEKFVKINCDDINNSSISKVPIQINSHSFSIMLLKNKEDSLVIEIHNEQYSKYFNDMYVFKFQIQTKDNKYYTFQHQLVMDSQIETAVFSEVLTFHKYSLSGPFGHNYHNFKVHVKIFKNLG